MDIADLRCALERYHAESFGWALACCRRDRGEAEDVLQTSYLKILEGRARFDERSSVKTWLFGVIRRTASEERRRRLLGLRVGESHVAQAAIEREQPGVDAVDDAQRSAELLAALASLAPRQREVLHLVFYHGMTIEDAATVMRVSVGTARTHYERGKARLRVRLRDEMR
jgi:RNA polymerase sigma factor (sigma-70 family)